MSMYRNAIQIAMPAARARTGLPSSSSRVLPLVKVTHVIPTAKGSVIAGELVFAHYMPPGTRRNQVSGEAEPDNAIILGDIASIDHVGYEVGWGLKSLAKGLKKAVTKTAKVTARGAKTVAKGTAKVAKVTTKAAVKVTKAVVKTPVKLAYKGTKGLVKANVKVLKGTGKIVLKGSKAAVKLAAKAPKALALAAIAPAGLGIYAAYKGAKFVGKTASKALGGGGRGQAALPPMEEETQPPYETPTDDGGEGYGGGGHGGETAEDETPPDVLAAPEADGSEYEDGYASDESADSYDDSGDYATGDTGEGSEENAESDDAPSEDYAAEGDDGYQGSDESENTVQGERTMGGRSEWVGLDEIAGEEIAGDDYDVSGSAGPNRAQVRKTGYTKYRRQYLPIASGSIAAGASATITIAPQTLFRGRKLSIPSAIAPSFLIDDLKVGNVSQGAAAGSVPAESFVSNATGEDNIQMDTASPGKTISINVTNTSGGALTFRATLFGDSVQ